MKTLFCTLILAAGLSSVAMAQEGVAVSPSKTEIAAGKTSGNFKFTLPEGTTAEDVAQNSKYYTHYFTVNYDAKSRVADITMISNDEKSRSVIIRFLVANSVEKLNIDGTLVSTGDYFEKYLK
ncbi:MAG: hypothetical protein V4638_03345 [Bacteroidota bacterium]